MAPFLPVNSHEFRYGVNLHLVLAFLSSTGNCSRKFRKPILLLVIA